MRKIFAFGTVILLAACSGGGSSTGPEAPAASPTPIAAAKYPKPKFTITIPKREKIVRGKPPQFVSSATLSVSIDLTADTAGVDPATLTGNPAVTNIPSGSCNAGCTISGPPSPIGSDTFLVTTYDAIDAGGHALDKASTTFTIVQGEANSGSITLKGIAASITFVPALPVGAAGVASSTTIGATGQAALTVSDAAGETITGTYANPVVLSDPDLNGDGTLVASSCPGSYPASNPQSATGTTAQLLGSSSIVEFCYGGLAEVPLTVSASSLGLAAVNAGFTTTLSAPAYTSGSGTPATVVVGANPPDVQLIAKSGTGSTATLLFTEAGWTTAPYDQTLSATATAACTIGGPFSTYGTVAGLYTASGTQFTVAVDATPAAGACPLTVGDGLTLNSSDATAALDTSYTSSTIGVNGRPHK